MQPGGMTTAENPFSNSSSETEGYRPRKPVNWRRRLAWVGGVLLTLTLVLWFIVSSGWFFRDVVLTRIEKSLAAEITASRIDWSPFSGVVLGDVRLTTSGDAPLFEAARVELAFSAWDLWNGRTDIRRITLAKPAVNIVADDAGRTNLDPILEALRNKQGNPNASWQIHDLTIRDGTLVFKSPSTHCAVQGLTADLDQAAPGKASQFAFAAQAKHETSSNKLAGEFNATIGFHLNSEGQWETADFVTTIKTHQGHGINLDASITPGSLKSADVIFTKNSTLLAELSATGQSQPDTGDWIIQLTGTQLSRQLLLSLGVDIADSTITSSHELRISRRDEQPPVVIKGGFNSETFRVTKNQFTTPPAKVALEHTLSIETGAVTLHQASLTGTRANRILFSGKLSNPARQPTWRDGTWTFHPFKADLQVNNLNLAQWRPVLEPHTTAGNLSLILKTGQPREADEAVPFQLKVMGNNLHGQVASLKLDNDSVSVNADGSWKTGELTLSGSRIDHVAAPPVGPHRHNLIEDLSLKLSPSSDSHVYSLSAKWTHESEDSEASGRLENNGTFSFDTTGLSSLLADGGLHVDTASGIFADARQLSADLHGSWSTGLIEDFTADFRLADAPAGKIQAGGRLHDAEKEWILTANIKDVDRRVLNFLGSSYGLDFRDTVLNATNHIRLSTDTRQWQMTGRATASRFSVARGNATTPAVELAADYQVAVDWPGQSARLDRLTLSGTQGERDLLKSRLLQPLRLDWSPGAARVPESTLEIQLRDVDFAEWQPLIGDRVSSGIVNSTFTLGAKADGRQLEFDLNGTGTNISANWKGQSIRGAAITANTRGSIKDLQTLNLREYSVGVKPKAGRDWILKGNATGTFDGNRTLALDDVTGRLLADNQPAGNFTITGNADISSQVGWAKVEIHDVPAGLLRPWLPMEPLKRQLVDGRANAQGSVRVHPGDWAEVNATVQLVSARLRDENSTDVIGSSDWATQFRGVVRKAGRHWGMRADHAETIVHVEGEPAGRILFRGEATLGPGTYEADLKYSKLENVRQDILRLLRLDRLGERKLLGGSVGYEGRTRLSTGGHVGLNGTFNLSQLRLEDPEGYLPVGPTDINLKAAIGARVRPGARWDVNATRVEGSITMGESRQGTFTGKAWYLADERRGRAEATFKNFDQDMARPFLKGTMPPAQLHRVLASGQIAVDIDPDAGLTHTGSAEVKGWQVLKPGRSMPSAPQDATVKMNLNRHRDILSIRRLDVQLAGTENGGNALGLSGWMDFSQRGLVKARMKLESDTVDLDSIIDALPAIPTSGKKRETDIQYALHADKIHWRGLFAEDFNGTLTLGDGRTIIDPMSMILEGGKVQNASLVVDLATRPFKYDLRFKGLGMRARPVLAWLLRDHFWTQQADWGQLNAQFRLQWIPVGGGRVEFTRITGLGEPVSFLGEQAELFKDSAYLAITGAEVSLDGGRKENDPLIPALVKLGLNGLSAALSVPELSTAKMNSAMLVGNVEGRQCDLELHLATALYNARTEGRIILHDPIGQSPIDLPVQVTLKPAIARKFKILGDLFRRNQPETLPVFLRLVGTLGKNEKKIDQLLVARIYTSSLTGKITNLPTEIIGRLPILRGLFPKPDPEAPPKPPDPPNP